MVRARLSALEVLALGATLLALVAAALWTFAAGMWPASVPEGPASYSDLGLAQLLRATVTDGQVRYDELARRRDELERYLDLLARVSPQNHPEQFGDPAAVLAYWLNAHRAVSLAETLAGAPTPDGSAKAFVAEHFHTRPIGGRRVSLWAIERHLDAAGDPRLWFAINAGARGLPAVAPSPYRGDQLDAELTESARRFVSRRSSVRLERGTVVLSQFFADHKEAFVAAVPTHQKNLLQLVWAFLPDSCGAAYPGCLTRGDLDRACGPALDACPVMFVPVDTLLNEVGTRDSR